MSASNENANNPYHRTAESYEKKLNMPLVRNFRKAEERALLAAFDYILQPEDIVLEIGCGTGYYTRNVVRRVRRVIALDDSETMLRIVKNRLPEEDRARVEFVRSEGTQYHPDDVDVVMHLGVMDYVKEWQKFLDHSLKHAKRAVVFTCPTNMLWGQVFHVLGRLEGSRIQRYSKHQIEHYLNRYYPEWHVEMEPVGLSGGWAGAMTWVVTAIRK